MVIFMFTTSYSIIEFRFSKMAMNRVLVIDTTNLKEPDDQNREADRMHDVGVII